MLDNQKMFQSDLKNYQICHRYYIIISLLLVFLTS